MKKKEASFKLPKSPTGIVGLDDITTGGLPTGRPTLLLGYAGSGKTIIAMEFLVNGIAQFNEPGVFVSFEEKTKDLVANVKSLHYDLDKYIVGKKLYLEHLEINREAFVEAGKYNLEGLFIRLELAIDKIKAKRIVLDSIDTLFHGYDNDILRSELKRLFSWLKEKNITAIITGETGDKRVSRHGLEEYIADCVIVLENRITDQAATRFLRIVKYRGSVHGNSEFPFTIDDNGVTIFPLISEPLDQEMSEEIVSTGISDLDDMLSKSGFYVGSSTLISGTAGTGKTSIAAAFALSICQKKTKCLYCAFEESPKQIIRNMRSIGISLGESVKSGRLEFYSSRPTIQNLELHFINIKKIVEEIEPTAVILDPVTNLMSEGPNSGVRLMLTRFVDFLKTKQITVIFTAAITEKLIERNPSDEGISSMVDTWIMVQDAESEAERKRTCTIMKSRGMGHSKMVMELVLKNKGISLTTVSHKKIEEREDSKDLKP